MVLLHNLHLTRGEPISPSGSHISQDSQRVIVSGFKNARADQLVLATRQFWPLFAGLLGSVFIFFILLLKKNQGAAKKKSRTHTQGSSS